MWCRIALSMCCKGIISMKSNRLAVNKIFQKHKQINFYKQCLFPVHHLMTTSMSPSSQRCISRTAYPGFPFPSYQTPVGGTWPLKGPSWQTSNSPVLKPSSTTSRGTKDLVRFFYKGGVMAERKRAPNSSSGISVQQSVCLSSGRDTCAPEQDT